MKLCLAMIVKNESKVITRALDSVRKIIDCYIIYDTGSTDGTIEIIELCLYGIPGEIRHRDFRNFSYNRSLYLEEARKDESIDYVLVLDADEVLQISPAFNKEELTADAYKVGYTGDLDYKYPIIFKNSKPFRYEGVTHEVPVCDEEYTIESLNTLMIDHRHDGGSRDDKFERDIRLLTEDLQKHPDNTRSRFYLANSYYDTKQYDKAYDQYVSRAIKGGWEQEVFMSWYRAGLCSLEMGQYPSFIADMNSAHETCPDRPDAIYQLGKFYNDRKQYHVAEMYWHKVLRMYYPEDPLFFYRPIYDYLMLIEAAVCYYYLGEHDEANMLNIAVITKQGVPAWAKELAADNMKFSKNKF